MENTNASSLDTYVMSYIDKLVNNVTKDLNANKVRLLSCRPEERAHIKCKIKSQFAVLEYLQGNRTKNSKIQLWVRIRTLKTKIKMSENQEKHNADKLCANWKVIDDLRMQLRQSQRKEKENAAVTEKVIQELSCQLREQRLTIQRLKEQFVKHLIPSTEHQEETMTSAEMEDKLQAVRAAVLRLQDAHKGNTSSPFITESDPTPTLNLPEPDRHRNTETSVSESCKQKQ
nr:ADP-ribosylation factor-like protein 6-interacting protein 6 isoform X4 [Nerophis lumbriciformis]XP_061833615.1 ADP-ribosylation factor-like protein 6-interacting protein 6 isoform X4 [Nerophis lumbriciformis]